MLLLYRLNLEALGATVVVQPSIASLGGDGGGVNGAYSGGASKKEAELLNARRRQHAVMVRTRRIKQQNQVLIQAMMAIITTKIK